MVIRGRPRGAYIVDNGDLIRDSRRVSRSGVLGHRVVLQLPSLDPCDAVRMHFRRSCEIARPARSGSFKDWLPICMSVTVASMK